MNRQNHNAYLQFITSMLIFGTIGIFRKYIPLSSGMLAFTRGLLGCVFLLVFLRIKNGRTIELPDRRNLILLAITGALIGLNWIFLFESYRYTSVTVATMCYYMQPTIVILLSPLVFKEKLTIKRFCCAAAAIIGMFFVSGMMDGEGVGATDTMGILCGLAAAALYASVIILNKKIHVDDAYQKTMVQLGAAALVLVPYLLAAEDLSAFAIRYHGPDRGHRAHRHRICAVFWQYERPESTVHRGAELHRSGICAVPIGTCFTGKTVYLRYHRRRAGHRICTGQRAYRRKEMRKDRRNG